MTIVFSLFSKPHAEPYTTRYGWAIFVPKMQSAVDTLEQSGCRWSLLSNLQCNSETSWHLWVQFGRRLEEAGWDRLFRCKLVNSFRVGSRMISEGFDLIKLAYLFYVFVQTNLSKRYRPRSDAAKSGVWSGSTLFATHPAILYIHRLKNGGSLKRLIR